MSDRLNAGERLSVDGSITSQDGRFTFIMQGDGNLVLYRSGGQARWATGTDGRAVSQAIMQDDGNFVIYGPEGAIWATGTDGHSGAWLIDQNDGNVVIYGQDGSPLWATGTNFAQQRTHFNPQTHGFHFGNNFVNRIATLPGGQQIETQGRCGGMAYAALDYYFAGIPIPPDKTDDFPGIGVPPDGHPLADYIYGRLIDSFLNTSAIRYLSWTTQADHSTWFYKGVTRWTKEDEIPRLRQFIDGGRPVVLGLIGARDIADVGNKNHQVVAYGYDFDPTTEAISIYIYDNNNPDRDVVLTTDSANPHVNASNRGEPWRGFFVHEYASKSPVVLPDDAPSRWSDLANGRFHTPDGDDIDFTIERGVVGQDVVDFVLALGAGVTWKKILNMPDGEGNSWDIVAEGANGSGSNGLWAQQVHNGQSLTFKKAKAFGAIWEVHKLDDPGGLTPGSRVTFRWTKD